ncbi:hypothetical protein [Pseudonocardia sp. MH-G8]|uniref:hypothetical protein n=1 Tax=Pseudonocardia sp. MH-G8 TaxID=1854588 RepID=UPI00117B638B|nr:hypothetical protein [Pseudonocardia sp. MH-G8]
MNAAERRIAELVADEDLDAYFAFEIAHLQNLDPNATGHVKERLAAMPTAREKRLTLDDKWRRAERLEGNALMRELNGQRISLWLAMVGLLATFAIGLFLDHELTLLLGALGGFLSPVVTTLTHERESTAHESSWGIMVLTPVGGALTAVGGLLLVRLLADVDIGILGPVFLANSWENAQSPVALALALLFGFSGRLFSRLAISAASQLGSPPPPPHGET